MPPSFSVTGGRALKGTIRPAGNKNAASRFLAATLARTGDLTFTSRTFANA